MFLMIRNPGVADPAAFTLLGVSTTRSAGVAGTIGQYGSGSKNAIAKLLRDNINPTIICGNLKMDFFSKPKMVSGQQFDQVCVKYSGKDVEGVNRSSTDDLGFTLQWGVQDWTKVAMGFRELVANAIDGATIAGGSYKDVEIEAVDKPRAKAGYTSVFLPLTPEIQACWKSIGTLFLHFSHPHLLNQKILPKLGDSKNVLIYKKGVLVSTVEEDSVFDYNLGEELTLDESRNAQVWDVRYSCSKAIASAEAIDIVKIIKGQIEGRNLFESKFETNYVHNEWESESIKKAKAEKFQAAFKALAGDNGVLVSGKKALTEFVEKKGFTPVKVEGNWFRTLEKFGVATEDSVLEGLEKEGHTEGEPSEDMIKALDMVWNMLASYNKLNGREKPPLKSFNPIMSGESQCGGMYKGGTVYIHKDHSNMGFPLLKIMLEEVAHHTTGASDMSRDLQDYLFRIIVELVF